jgi:hypothetical protein
MHIEEDRVFAKLETSGAVLRQQTNFGDATGLGTMSGEYFSLAAGVDTTPLFVGLEGNLCQWPHWGFVLRGQITTTDADGKQEAVDANDLFYRPPRHSVRVDEDAEIIMFNRNTSTPTSSIT